MEALSSANTILRKRKKIPASTSAGQVDGILTRSKAQMCIYPSEVIFKEQSPVTDFSLLKCGNGWGGASIKDLRARRVFTPDVESILQGEDKLEEGKESLERLDLESGRGRILDNGSGFVKLDETESCSEVISSEVEQVKQYDNNTEIPTKKIVAISGDASALRGKMALTLGSTRKIFKTPGSFGYRRMLPYLMDIANDDSRVSKIEIVDDVIPCTSNKSSEDKVKQNLQSVLPCNDKDLCGRKDKRDDSAENIGLHKMELRNHQDGTSQVHASLDERSIQMTPPDPDIFKQTENGLDKEYIESSSFPSENQIRTDQSSDGKELSDSINNLDLHPSSRRRVFKHPRSLSYRRLLPFLLEISNDNSIKQKRPIVEFIEKPHPLSTATSAVQKHVKNLPSESSLGSQKTEILEEILLPASIPPVCSYLDTGANPSSSTHTSSFPINLSDFKPNLEVSENGASPFLNFDLQTGGILQSQSSPRTLESECPHTDTNGLQTKEQSTLQVEESEQVAMETQCSDLGLELYDNNRESIENVQLNKGTLKMDVCNSLFSTIAGAPKGILKKNPRGCRGPCNCLNCASFHLHAERAFEFSKNQMHDAEEVALELMKELAKLRHLLKNSITKENGSDNVSLNLIQVKQACAESLEREKLAKVRLCQLNCELNIHCRMPALLQPKVTFSDYIRQRSFPMSNELASIASIAKTE
ncbi:hypothetical protein F511_00785 [Dorcoceras hygrometricum]|nr:hypothetical protein F511_00785 [Dorcoceras hygrometricum]